MLTRVGPAILRGLHKREAAFSEKMSDIEDWRVGWIFDQMKTRNITQGALATLMGITRASVNNQLFKTTQTSSMFRYAAMYVLQHAYYDTEEKKWVVID